VTLIYEAPGIYLTGRGKAVESGTQGDVVNITNLQSKRIVQGTVVGPGQVAVMIAAPRVLTTTASLAPSEQAPVDTTSQKAE
jgi:flagella basal body P-ring formation protein FlgA